jgi:hypothetical protein
MQVLVPWIWKQMPFFPQLLQEERLLGHLQAHKIGCGSGFLKSLQP